MEERRRIRPSQKVLRDLYLRSGNRCTFPGCDQPLQTEDGVWVGQIAHIEAAAPGGPRFREGMTDEERCAYENLLLLCELCRRRHKVHYADLRIMPILLVLDVVRAGQL